MLSRSAQWVVASAEVLLAASAPMVTSAARRDREWDMILPFLRAQDLPGSPETFFVDVSAAGAIAPGTVVPDQTFRFFVAASHNGPPGARHSQKRGPELRT